MYSDQFLIININDFYEFFSMIFFYLKYNVDTNKFDVYDVSVIDRQY